MKNLLFFSVYTVITFCYSQSNTVNLILSQDNTIYSDNVNNSSGIGDLFSGRTAGIGSNGIRRTLLQFDLTPIPDGALIQSASLTLNVIGVSNNLRQSITNYTLHRVTTQWGEGTSDGGGTGAPAITPDATWNDSRFGINSWTTSGGDFIVSSSSTTSFNNQTGSQTFNSSSGLVNDIQNWLDNSNPNFGWILIGDESENATARIIASRENTIISNRPTLTVTYDSTLNTEDFTLANSIKIYPNPSSDGFFNIIADNLNLQNAEIFNFLGQSIQIIDLRNRPNSINLSNILNSGIYFIRISDDEDRFIIKRISIQ